MRILTGQRYTRTASDLYVIAYIFRCCFKVSKFNDMLPGPHPYWTWFLWIPIAAIDKGMKGITDVL